MIDIFLAKHLYMVPNITEVQDAAKKPDYFDRDKFHYKEKTILIPIFLSFFLGGVTF